MEYSNNLVVLAWTMAWTHNTKNYNFTNLK